MESSLLVLIIKSVFEALSHLNARSRSTMGEQQKRTVTAYLASSSKVGSIFSPLSQLALRDTKICWMIK
jgi:hypothetical protein